MKEFSVHVKKFAKSLTVGAALYV